MNLFKIEIANIYGALLKKWIIWQGLPKIERAEIFFSEDNNKMDNTNFTLSSISATNKILSIFRIINSFSLFAVIFQICFEIAS